MWIYRIYIYIYLFWRECFALLEWLLLAYCLLTSFGSFFHVYLICLLAWWWFDFWSELGINVLPYKTFSEWKKGGELHSNCVSSWKKKSILMYIVAAHIVSAFCMFFQNYLCFPWGILTLNETDRLGESCFAFTSFVSSHFCCSPVPSYLSVCSVLYCSQGKKRQNAIVKLRLRLVIPRADHCQGINV